MSSDKLHPETWLEILAKAFALFDDLKSKGMGEPPFSLGGGTVLMLRYKHRLSKDIDFFGHDVQWLPYLNPRLNSVAESFALDYAEQANSIKIIMPMGDIDFVIAQDVATPVHRTTMLIGDRSVLVDPTSEILAKKMFFRAVFFKARDVYDLSASIDLDPAAARLACHAARSKAPALLRRLDEMKSFDQDELLRNIVPYDDTLVHAPHMLTKVRQFIEDGLDNPSPHGDI